ncbi:MAG: hypothetical protein LBN43_09785 [Oscillospiraceae bacterium]|jgi:hypothetical protein|nr:hypothetical protein [Oscillospiraceae bacterium]
MTERIVVLSDEILLLTKAQSEKLAENDIDGVSSILDKRAVLIDELSNLLKSTPIPPEARRILGEALDLSNAQTETAITKRDELTAEFSSVKRSYESIGVYQKNEVDTVGVVGSMFDKNT